MSLLEPVQAASDAASAAAMMMRFMTLFVQAFDVFEGVRREVDSAGGSDHVAQHDRDVLLLREQPHFALDLGDDLFVEIITFLVQFDDLCLRAAARRIVDPVQFGVPAGQVGARRFEGRDRRLGVVLKALLISSCRR